MSRLHSLQQTGQGSALDIGHLENRNTREKGDGEVGCQREG